MSNMTYCLPIHTNECSADINTIVPTLPKYTEFVSEEILSEKIKTVKDLNRFRWSIDELTNPFFKKVEEAISRLRNVHDVSINVGTNELGVRYSVNKVEVYHSVNINEYPDGLKTTISFSGTDYDSKGAVRNPLCKEETINEVLDIINKEILFIIEHLTYEIYNLNIHENHIRAIAKKYHDKETEKRKQLVKELEETSCDLEYDTGTECDDELLEI